MTAEDLAWLALGIFVGAYGLLKFIEYGRTHWGASDPRRR